ncbi:hypothetical protein F5Y04DRAFT_24926 [Hypomontagnella monticulosa]|nr:hypothetical protein F5Y04DRAFT_24926 [Hypomontagnella monticulosa]
MFFDSELNSAHTMLSNIYNAFCETATKMWAYARCLPTQKQPSSMIVISKSKLDGQLYFCSICSQYVDSCR